MKQWIFSAIAALAFLTAGADARAQLIRPGGACLRITSAAIAAETSGVELEAGTTGAIVILILFNGSPGDYGVTISAASLFDAGITVQASSMVFGQVALTSTVRRGRDSGGDLPADGDFILLRTTPLSVSYYIPPGKFFTIRQMTVNTATVISFCFYEPKR